MRFVKGIVPVLVLLVSGAQRVAMDVLSISDSSKDYAGPLGLGASLGVNLQKRLVIVGAI
jgi:hypothetical protein